jgi:hypothetical protein
LRNQSVTDGNWVMAEAQSTFLQAHTGSDSTLCLHLREEDITANIGRESCPKPDGMPLTNDTRSERIRYSIGCYFLASTSSAMSSHISQSLSESVTSYRLGREEGWRLKHSLM